MSNASHGHGENQKVYTRVALVLLAALAAIVAVALIG